MAFYNTKAYNALKAYVENNKDTLKMTDLFEQDGSRSINFSKTIATDNGFLMVDYSKNLADNETMNLLFGLLDGSDFINKRAEMFNGTAINKTEERAVLHTALRSSSKEPLIVEGVDIRPLIAAELAHIEEFSTSVRMGTHVGFTGKKMTDIVNIGIGGSDLGPLMVTEALKHYSDRAIKLHFVSNVDATHMMEALRGLDPETTMFLIASKTFTTQETMLNAHTARNWFCEKTEKILPDLPVSKKIELHFVALSTNEEAVVAFNIDKKNMFKFWNWVGGRYSVWSSIGLSIAISIGFDHFRDFLKGAEAMDVHFMTTQARDNVPVILALLGILYNNFHGYSTHAILPYDQYLSRFAAYFQQGDMESNGKSVDINGDFITDYQTGPIIWGEPGTNGQHAFFQLIHQGTKTIPCDFIMPINSLNPIGDHHLVLASNFFAQTEALMTGKTSQAAKEELINNNNQQVNENDLLRLANAKTFVGNKPTNTILIDTLTPFTLGMLVAMYEMKVFTQGVVWNINSFDQMGVELGKQLAKTIYDEISSKTLISSHDPSTNALLNLFKQKYNANNNQSRQ